MYVDRALDEKAQIEFAASTEVRGFLADLGRTEDVKFSPDNKRLALAGFAKNKLVVFDVDIDVRTHGKTVTLTDCIEISSPSLHRPHGLFFIDDRTIIVANRGREAPILRLPPRGTTDKKIALPALQTIRHDPIDRLQWPGSVSVSPIDENRYDVLICNNYADYVTRHVLRKQGDDLLLDNSEILLSKGLRIPDGVAVDRERRWIAISNHDTHSVFLYRNTPRLGRDSSPDGVLRKLNYPHGVRFTPDDNFVLVADAGSPYVNVYAKDGKDWKGTRDPVTSFRVMDEALYVRGRINPQEGGPKGIDIDSDMNVLATTCDQQGLAFFDLRAILRTRGIPMDWRVKSIQWRAERIRDDLRRRRGWK